MERRGTQQSSTNIDDRYVMLKFLLPLNEIVVDFHDHLKSISSGYASFDYEEYGFVPSKLVKVSTFMNRSNIQDTEFLQLGNSGKNPHSVIQGLFRND
jgi:translation elongation factor EF-4